VTAPLAGIRVLDLTRHVAGPLAVKCLAQLGADVIKVEAPAGDPGRRGMGLVAGSPHGGPWYGLQRMKQAIVLDLKRDRGKDALLELVACSDVLIENFRPGTTEALGIGPQELCTYNPRLVYCTITGFGSTGPLASSAATDGPIQAYSGVLYLDVDEGSPPFEPYPVIFSDMSGGLFAAQAILAALLSRERTGQGCQIDLGLFEAALQMMPLQVHEMLLTGAPPIPWKTGVPLLEAADGRYVIVQLPYPHLWIRFQHLVADLASMPELISDPRFQTPEACAANHDVFIHHLKVAFRRHSQSDWASALAEAGIPSGPVNNLAEALDSAQLAARGGLTEIDRGDGECTRVLAAPFHFSGDLNVKDAGDPPPYVGQHTRQVLAEVLGYTPQDIAALEDAGIVNPGVAAS
jgi:crotonobetainyl-CoA:carnitine CoA-transferase CaiB-like acyl-CoA transferase